VPSFHYIQEGSPHKRPQSGLPGLTVSKVEDGLRLYCRIQETARTRDEVPKQVDVTFDEIRRYIIAEQYGVVNADAWCPKPKLNYSEEVSGILSLDPQRRTFYIRIRQPEWLLPVSVTTFLTTPFLVEPIWTPAIFQPSLSFISENLNGCFLRPV